MASNDHPNPNVGIIYGRVSLVPQSLDGTSLATQFESGSAFCATRNIQVPPTNRISDDGVSGKRYWTRPGIQEALAKIERKEARWLVCENVDRAARRAKIGLKIAERVWDAGGILVCNGFPLSGETGFDRYLALQFFGLAELDYTNTISKLNTGRRQQVLGKNPSHPYRQAMQRGTPPYGLVIPNELDVAKGTFPDQLLGRHLIVEGDQHQADALELIRQMWQMHDNGVNLAQISNWLYEQGVPSPRGKSKWSGKTLDYMFRNEVYRGAGMVFKSTGRFDERREFELGLNANYRVPTPLEDWEELLSVVIYNPATGTWTDAPPIVDPDLWQRVRDKRDAENRQHSNLGRLKFYLSHFGICPVCGGRWAGVETKTPYGTYQYLRCSGHYEEGKRTKGCPSSVFRYINWQTAERVFLAALARLINDPKVVEEAIIALENKIYQGDSYSLRRDQLLHERNDIDKMLEVAVRRQIEAEVKGWSTEAYDKQIEELNSTINLIKKQLKETEQYIVPKDATSPRTRSQKLASIVSDIALALSAPEIDADRKAVVLSRIVDFVTVNEDGRLLIRLKNLSHIPDLGVEIIADTVYADDLRKSTGKPAKAHSRVPKVGKGREEPRGTETVDEQAAGVEVSAQVDGIVRPEEKST